jgi:hypothetical protein
MPTVKDKIVIGSTYAVRYECLLPADDATTPFAFQRGQKNPDSATAELWDVQEQDYVPLGPANAQSAAATVNGNIVTYTLPASRITEPGDYKLVITVNFPDGQIVRDIRPFKAVEVS